MQISKVNNVSQQTPSYSKNKSQNVQPQNTPAFNGKLILTCKDPNDVEKLTTKVAETVAALKNLFTTKNRIFSNDFSDARGGKAKITCPDEFNTQLKIVAGEMKKDLKTKKSPINVSYED